jgi:hypothetical protein
VGYRAELGISCSFFEASKIYRKLVRKRQKLGSCEGGISEDEVHNMQIRDVDVLFM